MDPPPRTPPACRISDLKKDAKSLRAGFTSEFLERADGYPGLAKKYGFRFGKAVDMEPNLMYQAVRSGQVDVISAFSTDGRIAAYNLALLEDGRHFFPPYDAAIVMRGATLDHYPEAERVLEKLSGQIDENEMQQLNLSVDRDKRPPRDVAHDFLKLHGWPVR
ncbi:MAG TPA: glycine betaine ABC transporter substrate-binding protein [Fimbriimonadaceae bacterium]|nr:glycine betaine ABC transporter substrate-binding protein [Fimbriimonadaceae bacterium]